MAHSKSDYFYILFCHTAKVIHNWSETVYMCDQCCKQYTVQSWITQYTTILIEFKPSVRFLQLIIKQQVYVQRHGGTAGSTAPVGFLCVFRLSPTSRKDAGRHVRMCVCIMPHDGLGVFPHHTQCSWDWFRIRVDFSLMSHPISNKQILLSHPNPMIELKKYMSHPGTMTPYSSCSRV